jgi:hypothetical protein
MKIFSKEALEQLPLLEGKIYKINLKDRPLP